MKLLKLFKIAILFYVHIYTSLIFGFVILCVLNELQTEGILQTEL
jgi:hypothetical protein